MGKFLRCKVPCTLNIAYSLRYASHDEINIIFEKKVAVAIPNTYICKFSSVLGMIFIYLISQINYFVKKIRYSICYQGLLCDHFINH